MKVLKYMKRGFFIIFLMLITSLVTAYVYLPQWLLPKLEAELAAQGVENPSLGGLEIDLRRHQLVLSDLAIGSETTGRQSIDRLALRLDSVVLTRNLVKLQALELHGARLLVTHDEAGQWHIPGIPDALLQPDETAAAEPDDGQQADADDAWHVSLAGLSISDVRLDLHEAQEKHYLALQQVQLGRLSTRDNHLTSSLVVKADIDGKPLNIDGNVSPLAASPAATLQLDLRDVDLTHLPLVDLPELKSARFNAGIDLSWQAQGTPALQLEGAAELADVHFVDEADLQLDRLEWAGKLWLQSLDDDALDLRITGKLDAPQTLAVKAPEQDLRGEGIFSRFDLRLQQADQWQAGGTVHLQFNQWSAELADVQSAQGKGLEWKGELDLSPERYSAKGSLRIQRQQAQQGERSLQLRAPEWQGELVYEANGALSLQGPVSLDLATANDAGQQARLVDLRWQGGLKYHPDKGLDLQGPVELLSLQASTPQDSVQLKNILWQGGLQQVAEDIRLNGDLQFKDIQASAAALDGHQARLQDLNLQGIELNLGETQSLALQSLSSAALQVAEPDQGEDSAPLLSWQNLQVDNLRGDAQMIDIDDIRFNSLQAFLQRDEDGNLRLPGASQESAAAPVADEASAAAPAAEPQAVPGVRIARIGLEGDSQLQWFDRSVAPVSRFIIKDIAFELRDIDSTDAERSSPFDLNANVGKYGRIKLGGAARLASGDVQLQGELKRIGLQRLTAYSEEALGLRVMTGQLDAELDWDLKGGQITAQNQLLLRGFRMESKAAPQEKTAKPDDVHIDDEAADKATDDKQQASLPLDTALELLRDSDGNIALSVPVSGDVDNPQFDYSDAINQAMLSAAKGAVLIYFQPLGLLSTAVDLASGLDSLAFSPINYPPLQETLSAGDKDYLQTMAGKLVERPGLRLNLCGYASPADAQALSIPKDLAADKIEPYRDEQLRALAERRSEAVRAYLIDKGLQAERLLLCAPSIAVEGDGRVEIGL